MTLLRVSVPLVLLSGAACGLAEQTQVDAIAAELQAANTRAAAAEAELKAQGERLELLAQRVAANEARPPGHAPPTASTDPPARRSPLAPDLQRRLDEVGVDVLERITRSDEAGDAMQSLGDLTEALIKHELDKLESSD